jgi:hypothetical protein
MDTDTSWNWLLLLPYLPGSLSAVRRQFWNQQLNILSISETRDVRIRAVGNETASRTELNKFWNIVYMVDS